MAAAGQSDTDQAGVEFKQAYFNKTFEVGSPRPPRKNSSAPTNKKNGHSASRTSPSRTRTWNLLLRRQTPYPLGQWRIIPCIDFLCPITRAFLPSIYIRL